MTTLFPLTIEVEEPKVGAVLRLHHMEGLSRFHLDFEKLKAPRGAARRNEFERHGHSAFTFGSAFTVLRRKGITETAGRGAHQLTSKAREEHEAHGREQHGDAMSLPPPVEKKFTAKTTGDGGRA